ncbi:AAA family protein [Cryptosporidium andersoni]|uniref:AAA family protein n=1 Tax=Cryptosporidium andersoni TaxID=117008 RepID=A0A1J4MV41_9CRYT|nr:AAA family protein [Cryptosporidium andersoni]
MTRNILNNRLTKLYTKNDECKQSGSMDSEVSTQENRKKIRKSIRKVLNEEFAGMDDNYGLLGRSISPEEAPSARLSDIGGIDHIKKDIEEFIIRPIKKPELYKRIGVSAPCGILLQGPPGTGKTHLSLCIAGEVGLPFFRISGPSLISGMSGSSEATLRRLFDNAVENAPCFVLIDEIDIISPKREGNGRDMERRIVAQFANCLDRIVGKFVIVIGTTSRPDAIDPMIRRNGRIDREISMPIPDEISRKHILQVLCRDINMDKNISWNKIARITPGFVGADLKTLVNEAALIRVNKMCSEDSNNHNVIIPIDKFDPEVQYKLLAASKILIQEDIEGYKSNSNDINNKEQYIENLDINLGLNREYYSQVLEEDLLEALKHVTPSSRREGFTMIPDTSWDDVGALDELRKDLELRIIAPIKHAHIYDSLGLDTPSGILLYGPPGCGKTLLAKAIARESNANFISIRGPELLNKYVGESERAVRTVFERARSSAPCIIFFDELDSLCATRSSEGNGASERVVNQLLTEMDGVGERKKVFIVAATNRPDIIDPAIMRPGRLDRIIYVSLPSEYGRKDILERITRKTPLANNVDLAAIATKTIGFSGADLNQLVREATLLALDKLRLESNIIFEANKEDIDMQKSSLEGIVTQDLLLSVVKNMSPSVNHEQVQFFEHLHNARKRS